MSLEYRHKLIKSLLAQHCPAVYLDLMQRHNSVAQLGINTSSSAAHSIQQYTVSVGTRERVLLFLTLQHVSVQ